MVKQMKKNNVLNGYLLLFLVLQGVNLAIIAIELLANANGYYLMITYGGSEKTYSFISLGLSLLDVFLSSLVVTYFLKRKKIFIKIYIVSTIYKVLSGIIKLILFFPLLIANDGFFNVINAVISIVFHIVMLFFWLKFFKNSIAIKLYLKSRPTKKEIVRNNGKKNNKTNSRKNSKIRVIK